MAETSLLRNNAIVRNASVGATPPHGPVKTGELPLVQVKTAPVGPQVREGQQRPVAIVPSKDRNGVASGSLPLVQVKMTQNGPQLDDGQDKPVVIRDGKQQTVTTGALPMVEVRMENGRPQVKNMPNVQAGPPQIPTAAPALSQPRAAAQPAEALPRAPHVQSAPPQMLTAPSAMGQPRVARVAAPHPTQLQLPEVPQFDTDELLLLRHAADRYMATEALGSEEGTPSDSVKLAADVIEKIDQVLVAVAVRAEAAALAAASPPPPPLNAYVQPRPVTGGHFSPASVAPQPQRTGYVAQRPGARSFAGGGARAQGNAAMAPRRVPRAPESPLPPVIVTMDGRRPVVQPTPTADLTVAAEPTTVPAAEMTSVEAGADGASQE